MSNKIIMILGIYIETMGFIGYIASLMDSRICNMVAGLGFVVFLIGFISE